MDFYHGKMNYEKALYFGNEAIKLGVNDYPIGYLIEGSGSLSQNPLFDIPS